jgi:tetratricopeptide (TPR) repeat protein
MIVQRFEIHVIKTCRKLVLILVTVLFNDRIHNFIIMNRFIISTGIFMLLLTHTSCRNEEKMDAAIASMDLKRGEVVSCSPDDGKLFGRVSFDATVPANVQPDFNTAIALLYSFEYDESEKMFAKVIDQAPDCAMAWWGVAMSNFHQLWAPPTPPELEKGAKAIQIARSIKNKTKRESDYIEAMATFYENADQADHRSRVLRFEKAMEQVYLSYPEDKEAAVFYALALNAAADPTDKTYARQKKAFSIINPLFQQQPLHPGLAHYIIHNFDYPALAGLALPAARKYASIAPASAHAQHMPSHIFIRLGLWDESIQSNRVSVSSAQCYAEKAKMKGHWDEELHGLDYLVYAYLQKGADDSAKQQVDYLLSIHEVEPQTFKTAYAFAAIPARYCLERKNWQEAANLETHPATGYPWEKFPWQKAIIHFTRLLGSVHTGNLDKAKTELADLKALHAILQNQKNSNKEAVQVAIQIEAGEAWIQLKQGNNEKALELMTNAANREDGMEKHPVTPGEVIPARELLAEMYLQMNKPNPALAAFEMNLQSHANRFNSLYGAGMAARLSGDKEKARLYFNKLLTIAGPKNMQRKELKELAAL